MLNGVTMKINVDDYIINTLKEDITSEDVSLRISRARQTLSASRTVLFAVLMFLNAHLKFLMIQAALRLISKTAILLKKAI